MKKITLILLLGLIFSTPQIANAQMSITLVSPPTMVSTAVDSTHINSFIASWSCVWPANYKSVSIDFQLYDSTNITTLVQCGNLVPYAWEIGDTIINYSDNLPNCLTVAYRVRMEVQFWSSSPIVIYSPFLYIPLYYGGCNPQGVETISKAALSVYPNPTTDFWKISGDQNVDWELFNMQGQLLKKGAGAEIAATGLPPATYVIRLADFKPIRVIKQ